MTVHDHIDSYEYEQLPRASFEEYRVLCDSVNQFRKIGIQAEESYEKALTDSRTIFYEINGKHMPLIASIETEKMYQLDRCIELTGREEVRLLALPLVVIRQLTDSDSVQLPQGLAVIVEEFGQIEDEQHAVPVLFADQATEVVRFVNPTLTDTPGHSEAWMAGYSVVPISKRAPHAEFNYHEKPDIIRELAQIWRDGREGRGLPVSPESDASGTFLFTRDDLVQRPDVIDGLWAVTEKGFGEVLGQGHPLSMEFSREFFDEQILASNVMTVVHFEEGEVLCFTFMASGFGEGDWLNAQSDTIKEQIAIAESEGRVPIHWYELISKGEKGMGYAESVLQEFTDFGARSNYEYQIFFESTNLSSLYVPHIVEKIIKSNDGLTLTESVRELDRLNYWAFLT